jgi:hypothetical protein
VDVEAGGGLRVGVPGELRDLGQGDAGDQQGGHGRVPQVVQAVVGRQTGPGEQVGEGTGC